MSNRKAGELTAEELRKLLSYDAETGVFTRRVDCGGIGGRAGSVAGTMNDQGYVLVSVKSHQYRAHRLAWLYVTGQWPTGEIDHKNADRSDNRWENLRDVSTTVNAQNKRRAQRNSKTGLLGACWAMRDKTFIARIKVDGRYRSLGSFESAEQAHAAYVEAKRRLHVGCTI